jgi:hypothetical protein
VVPREVGQAVTRFGRDQAALLTRLEGQYRKELAERRRLFNLVQELRGAW